MGEAGSAATMKKLSAIQAGISGEFLVAKLSRLGYVASLTLRNTRGIDILASNRDATKSVGIQVKTSQGKTPDWMLNKKAEVELAENLFYVFVCLPTDGFPQFYVVPRDVVARYVHETHEAWRLAAPGRPDTDIRHFKDPEGTHKDRWDRLGLD